MNFVSIRGAITITNNSESEILSSTEKLLLEICKANNIKQEDVVSITFSCTEDIDKVYPARAARNLGFTYQALMCFQEMYVEGSLPMCIRVKLDSMSHNSQIDIKHIYLGGAKKLRPDLGGAYE